MFELTTERGLVRIIGPAVALAVSAWLTWVLSRPGSRWAVLDYPNERSLHSTPTPRLGGIAIIAGVTVGWCVDAALGGAYRGLWSAALAAGIVAGASYVDDRIQLSAGVRLVAHFVAAVLLAATGFAPTIAPLGFALSAGFSVLFVVWMTNLYNFMDGMDGFAGGMAVFGFGTFALLGWMGGDAAFASLNLLIAAASAGFLVFNFPPARIFMGDTGSSTLGLAAGAMMLWAQRDGLFPLVIGILVFSPFIVDATVTLLRRAARREKIWQAHKTHYYQRLVQAGWGHRRTVAWEYVVMLGASATALCAWRRSDTVLFCIGLGWVALYGVLATIVARLERRSGSAAPSR